MRGSGVSLVGVLMCLTACQANVDVLEGVPPNRATLDAEAPGSSTGTDIVAAFTDTCAILGGALYCWGTAPDGVVHVLPSPVASAGSVTFRHISSGLRAHCADQSSGSAWCWGIDADGQLGQGDRNTRLTPTPVTLAGSVTRVRGRFGSFCTALESGALYCWGDNAEGQMGQPDSALAPDADALLPVQIPGGIDWTDADAGQGHVCGIRRPGRLFCWGRNTTAELGQGSNNPAQLRTPTQVGDAEDWLAVSTGQDLTCGLRAPGSVYCFGDNSEGQLGVGDRAVHDTPTRAGTDDDWMTLDVDTFHGCGIRKPGTLWCWGRNAEGQLGTGSVTDEPPPPGSAHDAPVRVGTESDWVQVSTGRFHTCGRRADGSLWCTGANDDGRLGTGDSKRRDVMTRVVLPSASSG